MEKFRSMFRFNPDLTLYVGIEREAFLLNTDNVIAPLAPRVLAELQCGSEFGYELSACQLEHRIGPCTMDEVGKQLRLNESRLLCAEQRIGFRRSYMEVAPEDMPLDVYPDPTGRYQNLVVSMPQEVLSAACRVIGTHVHIGMPDCESAIAVYNGVICHLDDLLHTGNGSNGERLELYRIVAPNYIPPPYPTWEAFHTYAVSSGFDSDPRRCWHLIRISSHGTIEFRMFGATDDLCQIENWARLCHRLCSRYLR